MMKYVVLVLTAAAAAAVVVPAGAGEAFRSPLRLKAFDAVHEMIDNGVDPGKPLFLTPFIERGETDKARQLSLVGPLKIIGRPVKSYSGFFTVNKKMNSNMFFWFFPAQYNAANAPVVLWLQGGPGGSSLFGLFVENGPLLVNKQKLLESRNITWASKYNMLYIDNPVGTGFSFTESEAGYVTNEDEVARDLYSCLTQFFTVFHEYKNNEFYASGESYAGKYVPAITYKIHVENQAKPKTFINLKGMAIGDGLIDPENMILGYADFMYNTGLVDLNQARVIYNISKTTLQLIKQKQWIKAFKRWGSALDQYEAATGSTFYYNYLLTQEPDSFEYYNKYVALSSVRKAIHVGRLNYNDGKTVETHLMVDVLQSVKPWVVQILNNNYKTLIYSGQLDVIIAFPLTEQFLRMLNWRGQTRYLKTERHIWRIHPNDREVAGFVRVVDNLYQVMVRGGGHILPFDQPERSFDMIDRFISNKPFF
ncbi:putative serine carboxypeptidase CPVL isoform X2 [Tubulanus polymorphus]|uniref:putative serine carboxypeptidase CPVL isoform X2 n=1 Tax=Tubulanus polymorphus TaxID=672921 RepID=UPI003DA304D7